VEGFLSRLAAYDIVVDAETMSLAWAKTLDLAQQHDLSTYDAAYLELALRRQLPLATPDRPLIAAAQRAGVPLSLTI
jgi:predicted nucleic acid-binding protein